MRRASNRFKLVSPYKPTGDQPEAIEKITQAFLNGASHVTLLGVTGSGKTFTMANVIERLNRPTLIITHNKTLAGQLYTEFKSFFPENAVEYFVSYYDYYQPEAYIPQTDTYIEKETSINEKIDRLRHSATHSVLERRDVIVVASVSCIYGLGSPENYSKMHVRLDIGQTVLMEEILEGLVRIQYTRTSMDLHRTSFRVRGDTLEIWPPYEDSVIRISLFGDEIEKMSMVDPVTGEILKELDSVHIYPAEHYVTPEEALKKAIASIEQELEERLLYFKERDRLLEFQRLHDRTRYDLEMLREMGYCQGIENYSRHLTGRKAGEPPETLLDYFPEDFLLFIDESHMTIPQLNGMYNGDRSRKETLVEFGFRLPSALDNRPLKFAEIEKYMKSVLYVSATPAQWELEKSGPHVYEQLIRPTGLLDPKIEIRGIDGQIEDLEGEIRKRIEKNERVLITTLTKRMAEDLTHYLISRGIRARYLHSEITTIERMEILRDLRNKTFDCLVGINLLREGLDLPEVSLVAILDADKQGFLRSATSLIQTIGRASRNSEGTVILYAETITDAMKKAVEETNRRRSIQAEYNRKHNITPTTIRKEMPKALFEEEDETAETPYIDPELRLAELHREMLEAAANLEFEKAAKLRDRINAMKIPGISLLPDNQKNRNIPVKGKNRPSRRFR